MSNEIARLAPQSSRSPCAWAAAIVAACTVAAVLAAVAGTARADRLILKDDTVVEGTVIKRPDGYWVKTPDGQSRGIPEADVKRYQRGAGATGGSAKRPATGG